MNWIGNVNRMDCEIKVSQVLLIIIPRAVDQENDQTADGETVYKTDINGAELRNRKRLKKKQS